MTELDFESDDFLSLLTDALRAGPGSPPWHEALMRLRAGGIQHADEYRLLVTAREHLESGREYRSVRAGPEFTKRLLASIEEEAARGPRRPPTTTTIAVISVAVMLIVLIFIGYLLWTAGEKPGSQSGTAGLLASTVTSTEFNTDGRPSDWPLIGKLPIEFAKGSMRYIPNVAAAGIGGGGIIWDQPIPADEPFAVAVNVRIRRAESNLIAQVFVTDDPEFSEGNATTPHEFIWLFEAPQVRIITPNGRIESQTEIPADRTILPLRITIDHDQALIDVDNQRQWSGANGLDPLKPRYVGLRFLRRSSDAGDGVVFQSLRVNMRQK